MTKNLARQLSGIEIAPMFGDDIDGAEQGIVAVSHRTGSRHILDALDDFLSPGYQDNLGWGFGTALGAKAAMPMRAISVVTCRRPTSVPSRQS